MTKKELQQKYNEIVLNTNGGVDDYVVALCQIGNAIAELDDTDERIKELERQLEELPKKICDEIRECSDVEVDEHGDVWIETDSASLDDIQEKYEKGAKNEKD